MVSYGLVGWKVGCCASPPVHLTLRFVDVHCVMWFGVSARESTVVGTPVDGSTAPYWGGANRFVKALNRCLLLCGYTLAGPPSRTKCGTCSTYGVHCSPKWLVRALREGLITTGCPRRGFRLGRGRPEAGPRALRPHHRRLRSQKTARHQIARATRHRRTATQPLPDPPPRGFRARRNPPRAPRRPAASKVSKCQPSFAPLSRHP